MKLQIRIDGRVVEAVSPDGLDVREITPGFYSILLDGRSHRVRLFRSGDGWRASVGSHTYSVEIEDPRNGSRRSRAALAHAHQDVKAPMPGKVVRVLVAEGDEVQAGQGLIVVEAMKMQNEIKALRAGRVLRITAQPGAAVTADQILATIE